MGLARRDWRTERFFLFGAPRAPEISRVEISPGQADGKRRKCQNDPGDDDGGLCRHDVRPLANRESQEKLKRGGHERL
jgi:hypothetical protein